MWVGLTVSWLQHAGVCVCVGGGVTGCLRAVMCSVGWRPTTAAAVLQIRMLASEHIVDHQLLQGCC